MADVIKMSCSTCGRRSGAAAATSSACHCCSVTTASGRDFHTSDFDTVRSELSLQGSLMPMDWQLPLPPVRFPLRDALLSFETSGEHEGEASALPEARGPLKAKLTEKCRAIREIGRMRRSGLLTSGLMAEPPQPLPRAPPSADRARTPPKAMSALASSVKATRRRRAEEAGTDWPSLEESRSAPVFGITGGVMAASSDGAAGASGEYRETWTSAARAVLSHSRRFQESAGDSPNDNAPNWAGASLLSYKHLPRPVKQWANRGFEFTDRGLGIGERSLAGEVRANCRKSPNFVYEAQTFGSVSLFRSDAASKPTKQPSSKHMSTETHRLGTRWKEPRAADRQSPCPGSYEVSSFVDELNRKTARRARGEPPPPGTGHSSHKAAAPTNVVRAAA